VYFNLVLLCKSVGAVCIRDEGAVNTRLSDIGSAGQRERLAVAVAPADIRDTAAVWVSITLKLCVQCEPNGPA